MVIILLILLGLCLGSFINAFVWRHWRREFYVPDKPAKKKVSGKGAQAHLPKSAGEPTAEQLSIVRGRSMCVHCHHELAARDLIPVVSYLWLRGRCRYCGQPIQDTPLAELLTPLLFVLSYIFWPVPLAGAGLVSFLFWLVFVLGFVALFVYDLRWQLLPYDITIPLAALALVQVIVMAVFYDKGLMGVVGPVLGAVTIGGMFYLLWAWSKGRWIGDGDVPLGVLLGLLAGGISNALLLIFIASFIGTLVAVPLLATGRATRTSHLPFGPFLILGGIIVVLFGSRLVDWYTTRFLVI
jgi:prepilin signal peptidase PulO-like enzyme (type II secretory pathway)